MRLVGRLSAGCPVGDLVDFLVKSRTDLSENFVVWSPCAGSWNLTPRCLVIGILRRCERLVR